MLRLLLSLMSVCVVAAALQSGDTVDFSACPITFYNKMYTNAFIQHQNSIFTICFDNAPSPAKGDCLEFDELLSNTISFAIVDPAAKGLTQAINNSYQRVASKVPETTPTCALDFSIANPEQHIYIIPYGNVTLVLTKDLQWGENYDVFAYVDTQKMMLHSSSSDVDLWLEGCRRNTALPMSLFSSWTNSSTCEVTTCSLPGTLTTESMCAPSAICRNRACVDWVNSTCAVVGNAVINSGEQVRVLEDFCTQTLLLNKYINLTSSYSSRRLTDVPFMERISFQTPTDTFFLVNDGKIHKMDSTVTIPENGTQINNFFITKVPGGVLVNFNESEFKAEVFFDGTTAHIHYEGYEDILTVGDMCANNSAGIKSSSPAGCDQVVSDPRGDGIDCGAVAQRCDALLKEPFTDCSVDPQPYISACTNLLCNYTDTDGVFCHLLDAYARSCQLQDWMDSVGCSASECSNKACPIENEFCGLSIGGEPTCFCRATYAAPYKTKGTLGKDTMCASKTASVSLVKCLLAEKGINISSLHLNDPSCTGVQDPKTNMVTFSFNDADHCAANVTVNGSRIIYSNTIMSGESGGIITRDDQLSIQFSCAYAQPQVQTMSLKIMDSSVVKVIDAGEWTYVFNMTAFTDGTLASPVDSSTELSLDQQLWVQAKATEVDDQLMALVIEGCWATKENNANAAQKYSLIKNGCSDEGSVEMGSNGEGLASVFSFRVFQFVGSEADVYLHCDTKLCLKSSGCTKSCA